MTPEKIKSKILKLLGKHLKPMSVSQIAESLSLRRKERKKLQRFLNEMTLTGELFLHGKMKYKLGNKENLITGTIEIFRNGAGMVTSDDGDIVIRVDKSDMGQALPGDRVLCRRKKRYGRYRLEEKAAIVKIIERAKHEIVGTLKKSSKLYYVVPISSLYRHSFYVIDVKSARPGDRVVIKFKEWPSSYASPEGEIIDIIGPEDNASLDTITIIRQFGLAEKFSDDAINEASNVSARISEQDDRLDIRDKLIITVDPERARDYDDALSLDVDEKGRRVLGVHIADVSHFVRQDSVLDKEARIRGNSVYFPDKVIPMLPEQLSNGVCSLVPEQDRLAFSVFITFDKNGKVIEANFAKTLIRSSKRLTYEQAFDVLKKGRGRQKVGNSLEAKVERLLWEIHVLAQQMRELRFKKYALDIDMPDTEVVIDSNGMIKEIRRVENDISHQMIEECMVAANEAVASFLHKSNVPLIFRTHEPPKEDRLKEAATKIIQMGYRPGNLAVRRNMAAFLKSLSNNPLRHHIRVEILRSMNRAMYTVEPLSGHYGLAKKYYTHFTSPIRRYTDLVVHRQLNKLLKKEWVLTSKGFDGYKKNQLSNIALHCSLTEQNADEAERAILEIKKYRYLERELKDRKIKSHKAVVTKVTNYGLFVELQDLFIQGLIHISSISTRYVRFDAMKSELRAGRDIYKVGRILNVIVVKVDFENRMIDFALVDNK